MKRGRRSKQRRTGSSGRAKASDPHALYADLVSALNHPLRKELLKLLIAAAGPRSPKELAKATKQPLPNVSYHVRVLEEKGAVELTDEESVRGTVAHFYKVTALVRSTPWVMASLDQPVARP
jgi:DNA-binding transcriptional ArsR family regulator